MNPTSPLPTHRLPAGTVLAQSRDGQGDSVTMDSPALEVMTDLTRVKAATIAPSSSLQQAEQFMIHLGVRMLFVVREMPAIEGIVTATDLHGDVQMRLVQQRNVHYDELTVADVTTRLASLDAVDFDDLGKATVRNVVATLRRYGRHYLLVVDGPAGARRVRGVISRTQIERQLGARVEVTEVATTFPDVVQMLS